MESINNPERYINAVKLLSEDVISLYEFFLRCLAPLDSEDVRSLSPLDHVPDKRQYLISVLYAGTYGPLAASIIFCLDDAHFVKTGATCAELIPVYLACSSKHVVLESVIEAIQSRHSAEALLESSLFRQSLAVAALLVGDTALAAALISLRSTPIDAGRCVFQMGISPLASDSKFSSEVVDTLLRCGWIQPTPVMLLTAIKNQDKAGIAILQAVRDITQKKLYYENPMMREVLIDVAIESGTLEALLFVKDLYGLSTPPRDSNKLVQAVHLREAGGVDVIRWLLEQGLDVNRMYKPPHESNPDPRAQAERDAENARLGRAEARTALHAATYQGNVDAVQFLVEHGADKALRDGYGQTAREIALRRGNAEIAAFLR